MTNFTRAYVGLGSNLDAPIEQVRTGIEALRRLPDSHVVKCSSLYRTAPVGIAEQPDFINAVCALDTTLAPQELLQRLQAIEHAYGRTRGPIRGGPRTLDLDLLLYGDLELSSTDIALPHPRMHERAFVLQPLCEIAPALRVPGRGPAADLLAQCPAQPVARLTPVPAATP